MRVRGALLATAALLLRAAATLLLAALGVQAALAFVPGDAIDTLPDPALRAALAAEWGLAGSLPERLAASLGRLLRLDLGESLTWRPGAPVTELVAQVAPDSVGRLLAATTLSVGVGLLLARSRPGWVSVLSAPPAFLVAWAAVTGLNALAWTGMEQGWWSRPDWFTLPDTPSLLRTVLAVLVIGGASGALAEARSTLAASLRELDEAPFVEAAWTRGAPVWPIYARHLLVPLSRCLADRLPALLGSLVVVERLLLLPGAGNVLWEACALRDWPLASALVLASAAGVVVVRLGADLVEVGIDPRRRA